jgi:hypothetical protein
LDASTKFNGGDAVTLACIVLPVLKMFVSWVCFDDQHTITPTSVQCSSHGRITNHVLVRTSECERLEAHVTRRSDNYTARKPRNMYDSLYTKPAPI